MSRSRLLFVVNADWFFVSHRLPLALAARRAGFEVAVCAGASSARQRIEDERLPFFPMPISRGGTDPRDDVRTISSLVRTYRQWRPDIVHHVTIKPVLYGSLATRVAGVRRRVNAVSGLGSAFIDRGGGRDWARQALRLGLRQAYRGALSGVSTRTIFQNADDLEGFVAAGIAPRRTARLVHGSGVSFERFAVSELPAGPPIVLLPARLLRDKGVLEFVEAARILRPKFPDARFVLVGRLDLENPTGIAAKEVAAWVADGLLEWWGAKEHDEMPGVYAASTLVVLPSYREGLPLALAEAAACGRPVVTTNVPGCRDAVLAGETGWVCAARDAASLTQAISDALSAPDELRRRGCAGAAFARGRFAVEHVVAQTLEIYDELLRANTRR